MDMLIRSARIEDAAEIARLSGELGYPCTTEVMTGRLSELLTQPDKLVVVAASGNDPRLFGWIAAESRLALEHGRTAEIVGLVVDAAARRLGLGARLLAAAESWARASGHDSVVVRSNAVRLESHPFYAGHGYVRTKTQHVYCKPFAV